MIEAIVMDIEGTTTDILFVKNVLFPYAKQHLPDYVIRHQHQKEIDTILQGLKQEVSNPDLSLSEAIDILHLFIEQDKKSTALKTLQGMIWQEGYQQKQFTGHIYSDVLPALIKWKQHNIKLYIYSSGSIQAQKLLFSYTISGDITSFIDGYFDTNIGSKNSPESYKKIAEKIGVTSNKILFLSDSVTELSAAKQADWQVIEVVRNNQNKGSSKYYVVHSFSDISLGGFSI